MLGWCARRVYIKHEFKTKHGLALSRSLFFCYLNGRTACAPVQKINFSETRHPVEMMLLAWGEGVGLLKRTCVKFGSFIKVLKPAH